LVDITLEESFAQTNPHRPIDVLREMATGRSNAAIAR
jgi:hypothetical protein